MRTSLGPAPLSWGKKRLLEFYRKVIRSEIDDIYIGELSCPQRGLKFKEVLLDIAHLIKDSQKNLYISSYALVTKIDEIKDIKELLKLADGMEINNLAYLGLNFDKTLIAGPHLNVYNWQSANYLAKLGFKRAVLPPELTLDSIIDITKNSKLEIEIIFQGRMHLAISRNCYTIRAIDSSKTVCDMECLSYPDGLSLDSLFRINGKGVLSERVHSLADGKASLERSKVASIRFGYEAFN